MASLPGPYIHAWSEFIIALALPTPPRVQGRAKSSTSVLAVLQDVGPGMQHDMHACMTGTHADSCREWTSAFGRSPRASSSDSLRTTGYAISGEFTRSLHILGGSDTQQLLSGMRDTTRLSICVGTALGGMHASVTALIFKHGQGLTTSFDDTRRARRCRVSHCRYHASMIRWYLFVRKLHKKDVGSETKMHGDVCWQGGMLIVLSILEMSRRCRPVSGANHVSG